MRISFYNSKGGTGKSTSAANLAHAFAMEGKRVILCDLDPQASASFHLGVSRSDLKPSMSDVLLKKMPIARAIRETSIEGLDLITSDLGISSFDTAFASSQGREFKLRDALNDLKGYDLVLIDLPPTMGLLSLNAVVASRYLIVPTIPHHLNLQGLRTLEESLALIQKGFGECAEILGILPTQLDRRSKAAVEMMALMYKHYGNRMFKVAIPANAKLSEAPSHGKTIFQHDSTATGAKAYREAALEIIKKIKNKGTYEKSKETSSKRKKA